MVKRTLQEIANFFDMAVAVDADGHWYFYESRPSLDKVRGRWCSDDKFVPKPDLFNFDFSGDWRESLTLPDSWPKGPKFREGELVFNCKMNGVMVWRDCYGFDVFRQCRHLAEDEWKVLKGGEL